MKCDIYVQKKAKKNKGFCYRVYIFQGAHLLILCKTNQPRYIKEKKKLYIIITPLNRSAFFFYYIYLISRRYTFNLHFIYAVLLLLFGTIGLFINQIYDVCPVYNLTRDFRTVTPTKQNILICEQAVHSVVSRGKRGLMISFLVCYNSFSTFFYAFSLNRSRLFRSVYQNLC